MSTTSEPITSTYQVVGMTCGHCVAAVEREVGAIAGVTGVTVDLASGDVVISSTHPINNGAIAAAIDEAGYELAS